MTRSSLLLSKTSKATKPTALAFLAPDSKATTGQRIQGWRIGLKKTRKEMAAEMGVSVKTLWGWENDFWLPIFGKAKLRLFLIKLHSGSNARHY